MPSRKKLLPSLLLTNAQSLTNKMGEFDLLLRKEQVDIAVVTETWAHEEKLVLQQVSGYQLNSVYRTDKKGGGVSIYADKNINQTLMQTSLTNDAEIIAVQFSL